MDISIIKLDCDGCSGVYDWIKTQPDHSPEALWATCPKGSWMIEYVEAYLSLDEDSALELVVYRAVNRALGRAANSLDCAEIPHTLHEHTVTDKKSSFLAAAELIRAGQAIRSSQADRKIRSGYTSSSVSNQVFWAANAADWAFNLNVKCAADIATAAANSAFFESEDALIAEQLACANDCRELLSIPHNLK